MTIEEIIAKAYQLYPVSPNGFLDGDITDCNSEARSGYIRGYQDALKDMGKKK